MSKSTKTTKATKSTNNTESTKVTKETKNAKDAKSAKETKSMKNTKETKNTAENVSRETKAQERQERIARLTATLESDLNNLALEFRINSEGFYMTKIAGCSVKCQMNKKAGTYKVLGNERLVKALELKEEEYEFHKGWNMPYLVKLNLADMVARAPKAEKAE